MGRLREDMGRIREKTRRHRRIMAAVGVVALAAVACKPTPTGTQTGPTDFNSPDYSLGTINGQHGWSSTGSAGAGAPGYDHAVDDVAASGTQPSAYGFGDQSLRMSDAVTSGSFGDQTFSAPTVDESGETAANAPDNGQHSGGVRHGFWESSWSFGDAGNPFAVQPGLHVVASPDRGDGARMSWVEMADCSTFIPPDGPFAHECQLGNAGLEVNFEEYNKNLVDDPNESKFSFVNIASGLDRTVAHTVRLRMWFFQGPDNDVVQVCVDTTICHTGRSWEDYYREQEGNPSRPVDSLLFRTGGTADPGNAGNGFFIDNVNLRSFTYTGAAFDVTGDAQVNEGNAGPGDATASYSVTLDAPVPFETTVHYATHDGTATAPSDYTSTSGDLTFPPNTVGPQVVPVPINGDTTDESHENFSFVLSNPVSHGLDGGIGAESFPKYVAIDTGTKQTTIRDDDSTVSVSDGPANFPEGNSGTTPMPFTVTLANPSSVPVSVHFQTANGSATSPSDYLSVSGTVNFAVGQTSRTVNVTIKGDATVEADENFIVNLSAPVNATIGDGVGVGIIKNDDGP